MKNTKKLFSLILIILLNSCVEQPTKIYPKNGMFSDMKKTYDLDCYIEWGKDRNYVEYNLKFNSSTGYVEFRQENFSKPFKPIKIIENNEAAFVFQINNDKKVDYQLFRKEGDFGVDIGSTGYCIEKGYGWVINKNNTATYQKKNKTK